MIIQLNLGGDQILDHTRAGYHREPRWCRRTRFRFPGPARRSPVCQPHQHRQVCQPHAHRQVCQPHALLSVCCLRALLSPCRFGSDLRVRQQVVPPYRFQLGEGFASNSRQPREPARSAASRACRRAVPRDRAGRRRVWRPQARCTLEPGGADQARQDIAGAAVRQRVVPDRIDGHRAGRLGDQGRRSFRSRVTPQRVASSGASSSRCFSTRPA